MNTRVREELAQSITVMLTNQDTPYNITDNAGIPHNYQATATAQLFTRNKTLIRNPVGQNHLVYQQILFRVEERTPGHNLK